MAEHQKGSYPGTEELRGVELCWESHEGHHTQDTGRKSLSQLKFTFQRPEGYGTP